MQESSRIDRRTALRAVGGLAVLGSLAGCSSGDGGGGDDGDGETDDGGNGDGGADTQSDGSGVPQAVSDYLSETSNFDGIEDFRGESPTVDVGVQANGGAFGYGPPAIRIDAGSTVTWEWTGEGSFHDVIHEEGDFESEQTEEAGFTFEHTFDSAGTYLYYCTPHEALGMKGAVIVE